MIGLQVVNHNKKIQEKKLDPSSLLKGGSKVMMRILALQDQDCSSSTCINLKVKNGRFQEIATLSQQHTIIILLSHLFMTMIREFSQQLIQPICQESSISAQPSLLTGESLQQSISPSKQMLKQRLKTAVLGAVKKQLIGTKSLKSQKMVALERFQLIRYGLTLLKMATLIIQHLLEPAILDCNLLQLCKI